LSLSNGPQTTLQVHLITWQVRYLNSLPFPRAFHPSRRHYNTSEVRKCGSSYNNLLYFKVRQSYIVTDQNKIYECWVLLLHNLGGKNPSRINSKKFFLTQDPSSRSFSLDFLLWAPPWNRNNKNLMLLHLKQHGTKPWVRNVLSQVLPIKIKDSQGYAGLWESRYGLVMIKDSLCINAY
jgi:hypothetical protein